MKIILEVARKRLYYYYTAWKRPAHLGRRVLVKIVYFIFLLKVIGVVFVRVAF